MFGMAFKKIEVKKKSMYAAEQLLNAIKNGAYKVGDRLPTERELAEQMGISRPSIREALSALHIAGIIEGRPGDGTYVTKAVEDTNIEAQVLSILRQNENPIEVLEAREALEEGIVKLAARKATPKFLEKIKNSLARMEEAATLRDYEGYLKADLDFHLAILAASQNRLLEAAARPIIEGRKQNLWKGLDQLFLFEKQDIAQTLEEHKRILNAIELRDSVRAAQEMSNHLKQVKSRMMQLYGR